MDKEKKHELYKRWKILMNMTPSELKIFMNSSVGKMAGLSRKKAKNAGKPAGGIRRDSARAIIRMKSKKTESWNANDWEWAKRQVSFIARMKGIKGKLRDKDGNPTRKLLALKIWGHNPEKKR